MKKLYSIFLILFLAGCRFEAPKETVTPTSVDSSATATPDTSMNGYDGEESLDTSTFERPVTAVPGTDVDNNGWESPNVGRGPASAIEDTVEVEGIINSQGQLIFYCPKKLKEGQSVHVTAAVTNQIDPTIGREMILNSINNQNEARGEERISIDEVDSRSVTILDSVKLELEDPSKRVEITPETDQALWRKVGKGETAEWSWYIIPKKEEGGKAPVILYLKAFTKNVGESPKKTVQQYYPLSIDLPETVIQAFLRKLRDIDWLVGIIGAIIAYFIGMWRERKKQKETK